MIEVVVAVVATLSAAFAGAWFRTRLARAEQKREAQAIEAAFETTVEILKHTIQERDRMIRDLHARVVARDPSEYRAWAWEAPGPETQGIEGEYIHDETGLMAAFVPPEDRKPPADE